MRPVQIRLSFAGLGALALAGAASAQTGDRYGSGPVLYATPGSRFAQASAPVAAPLPSPTPTTAPPRTTARVLNWPGKTAPGAFTAAAISPPPARTTPVATRGAPPPAAAAPEQGWIPVAAAPTGPVPGAPRMAPPVRPWTQRYATAPTPSPPAPTSIYAAAAPNPSTGAPSGGARYYSLHRAYGMTPDAAPIPPQFFGPTADLSTPETTEAVRRANATAAAVNTARLASETAQ